MWASDDFRKSAKNYDFLKLGPNIGGIEKNKIMN